MGASTPSPRSAPAVLAALAFAGAGAAAAGLDPLVRGTAAPVLLVGLALPILLHVSPGEPSRLKLGTFALLGSPPLAAGLWLGARACAGPRAALVTVLAAAGVLALSALRAPRARREPLGRAAWTVAGGAAAAAAALAFALRDGAHRAAWYGPEVLGRVLAAGRSVPAEEPFAAGRRAAGAGLVEAAADLVRQAFGLGPSAALAAVAVAAAAAALPAVYVLAAPLWRDGRALVVAALFAAVGVGAPSLVDLAAVDPLRAVGAALVVGSWAAAAHALRHGFAPWPLLCGAFAAAAVLAHPAIGVGGAACVAAAALFAPATARPRALLGLAAGVVPALVAARALGADVAPALAGRGTIAAAGAVLGAVSLLSPAARAAWADRERRPIVALLAVGLLLGPGDVAAAVLVSAWLVRGGSRVATAAALGTALALLLASARVRARDLVPAAGAPLPVVERDGRLALRATSEAAADLARLLDAVARDEGLRGLRPVLLARPGDLPFAGEWSDLDERWVALFADLPLWAARGGPRAGALARAFGTRDELPRELVAELDELGRPALWLVTPIDRRSQPWLLQKPGPWGFRVLRVEGGSVLFVRPAALAGEGVPFPDHLVGPDRPRVLGETPEDL